MSSIENKKGFHYCWVIVGALCFIVFGSLGFGMNCLAFFFRPMAEELGIPIGSLMLFLTIQALVQVVCYPIAAKILAKVDFRIALSIAAVLLYGSCIAISRMVSLAPILALGVVFGIGVSFLQFLMVPILVNNWFVKKNASVIGFIMAFTGVGGMVLTPIASSLITTMGSWRNAFALMAIVIGGITLFCTIFLIRSNPAEKGLKPYGADEIEEAEDGQTAEVKGVTLKEARKMPLFYMVILATCLMSMYVGMNNNMAIFVGTIGHALAVSAAVTAALSAGTMISKILLGIIKDKFGYTASVSFGAAGGLLGLVFLMMGMRGAGATILIAGGFFYGVGMAMFNVMPAIMTRTAFGAKDYANIYSIVVPFTQLIGAFTPTIHGTLFDRAGSYGPAIIMDIVFLVAYLILSIIIVGISKRQPYYSDN